jgi:hypothetical protein
LLRRIGAERRTVYELESHDRINRIKKLITRRIIRHWFKANTNSMSSHLRRPVGGSCSCSAPEIQNNWILLAVLSVVFSPCLDEECLGLN